jgi:hypothetical protein
MCDRFDGRKLLVAGSEHGRAAIALAVAVRPTNPGDLLALPVAAVHRPDGDAHHRPIGANVDRQQSTLGRLKNDDVVASAASADPACDSRGRDRRPARLLGVDLGGSTLMKVILGIAAPAVGFAFWGTVDFHHAGRLAEPLRLGQELAVSLLAAVAWYAAGNQGLGFALGGISIVYHALVY